MCDCVCVWLCVTVCVCDCVWLCDYVWLCVTVCDCVDEKERAMWLLCVMWQSGWEGDEWWMMRGDGCCVLRSDEKWWEVMGEWWKTQKRNSSTRGSQVVTYPSTRLAWGGLTSRSGTRSGANRLVWPELSTYAYYLLLWGGRDVYWWWWWWKYYFLFFSSFFSYFPSLCIEN